MKNMVCMGRYINVNKTHGDSADTELCAGMSSLPTLPWNCVMVSELKFWLIFDIDVGLDVFNLCSLFILHPKSLYSPSTPFLKNSILEILHSPSTSFSKYYILQELFSQNTLFSILHSLSITFLKSSILYVLHSPSTLFSKYRLYS